MSSLRIGTFCSGIAAPEVAWRSLGWTPQFVSEIDPFASAVLAHHLPTVPNLGDMEAISDAEVQRRPVDLVCAGTPCQSFSVAGLRGGMADPRGNLALVFLRLVDAARPRWLVWENVPGVLSSNGGRDFGTFLGALGQLGYGWSYRVLDAQHFGVPQRRRRVFVVGHLGDWRLAAAVLFERHCLQGHSAPRREAGARIAASLTRGADSSGKGGYAGRRREDDANIVASTGEISHCLNAGGMGRQDYETETLIAHTLLGKHNSSHAADQETYVAHSLRGEGFDASEDGTGRGTPLVPMAFDWQSGGDSRGLNPQETAQLQRCQTPAVTFIAPRIARNSQSSNQVGIKFDGLSDALASDCRDSSVAVPLLEVGKRCGLRNDPRDGLGVGNEHDPMFTLQAGAQHGVSAGMAVRRLTPRECERLQGFPDNWTLIPRNGAARKAIEADFAAYMRRQCPDITDAELARLAADGPRYRAIGNSMAVPVLKWIGERIEMVEALTGAKAGAA